MEKKVMLTDEQLVCQYIKGNNEAFNILLDRYESRVFTYIMHFVKNREVAEDLFQDIFMRVITTLRTGRYKEQQKFYSWLMRVAHNQTIDYLRQTKNANNILSNDESETDLFNDARLADEHTIERKLIDQQNLSSLESLIRMLPDNQQEIIRMRYYENRSFKEISAILGCSINTSLGRARYAMINLRKLAAKFNVNMAS